MTVSHTLQNTVLCVPQQEESADPHSISRKATENQSN